MPPVRGISGTVGIKKSFLKKYIIRDRGKKRYLLDGKVAENEKTPDIHISIEGDAEEIKGKKKIWWERPTFQGVERQLNFFLPILIWEINRGMMSVNI